MEEMPNVASIDAVTLRETLSEHIGAADLEGFGVMTEAERMEFMYGDLDEEERQRCAEQESGMLIVVAEMHQPPPESKELDQVDEEILCSQNSNGRAEVLDYSYRNAANNGKLIIKLIQS